MGLRPWGWWAVGFEIKIYFVFLFLFYEMLYLLVNPKRQSPEVFLHKRSGAILSLGHCILHDSIYQVVYTTL